MGETYPFTTVPNSLRRFLKSLPDRSVPPKVTKQYLRSIGLKSSNDPSIIHAMKNVGLLDGNGAPTDTYRKMRNKGEGPAVLAGEIRKAYKPLYQVYEDAHSQEDENIRNVFRETADHLAPRGLERVLATFKTFCEFADFTDSAPSTPPGATPPAGALPGASRLPGGNPASAAQMPQIHVNVQIHIPESKDPLVYDAIFEAMVRHVRKML